MTTGTLTITTDPDWKTALRKAGGIAQKSLTTKQNQPDILNFESPGAFFANLNERRWALLRIMLGQGTVGVRELARRVGRDVKGVHTDASVLVSLGLLQRNSNGALCCPYDRIRVDMLMEPEPAP
ncbi:hypothetical protein [Paracandidimonas soli]|uniref:Putative transcriptional regulator n=1 Tax=Paracandidimonas soli TaxID=1917182 RepID=A0A4R3V475_9BURK|nr:hypothetical protein [Paracandidimonas soli]TCU98321.1 putative transcriptional regulator [Paracandidimonas soli]